MTKPFLVEALIVFALAVTWLSCLGLLVMRNVLQRLHFVTPIATLATIAIAAALLISEPFSQVGIKVLLVLGLGLGSNAVLAHATAAAAYTREHGRERPRGRADAPPRQHDEDR